MMRGLSLTVMAAGLTDNGLISFEALSQLTIADRKETLRKGLVYFVSQISGKAPELIREDAAFSELHSPWKQGGALPGSGALSH